MLFLALQTALLLLAAYILGAYCGSRLYRLFASADLNADLDGSAVAFSEQPFIELETGPPPPAPNLAVANRFERALLGTRQRPGRSTRLDLVPDVSQPTSHGSDPDLEHEVAASTGSLALVQSPELSEATTRSSEAAEAIEAATIHETEATETELIEGSAAFEADEPVRFTEQPDPVSRVELTGLSDVFEQAETASLAEATEATEPSGATETIEPDHGAEATEVMEASEPSEIIESEEPTEDAEPFDPISRREPSVVSDVFEPNEAAGPSDETDTEATRVMMKQPGSAEPAPGELTPMTNDHASPAPSLPVASSTGGITGTSAPLAISSQQSADDLTRIHAIDPATAAQLAELGVNSYARLAAFTRADVDRIGATIERSRITREGWIEQAQLLANGRETAFSRLMSGNSAVEFLVPSPQIQSDASTASAAEELSGYEPASGLQDAGGTAPAPVSDVEYDIAPIADTLEIAAAADDKTVLAPVNAILAPAAEAVTAGTEIENPVEEALTDEPIGHDGDDLTLIRGIDSSAAAILRANGVTTFRHIADCRSSEMRDLEVLLGLPGQSRRHNWQKQARRLIKRGTTSGSSQKADVTASAVAPAASVNEDLQGVSVPSAPVSLPGELMEAEPREASNTAIEMVEQATVSDREVLPREEAARGPAGDDLKRIRGIGYLIEKKLNSLGVSRYDQIANWTAAEIDRISQMLDFKGRIEREAWVEQARILVSGGQTEFSNRVDREY